MTSSSSASRSSSTTNASGQRSHFIFFDYACRTDGTDVKLNDEAEEYVWVTLDEALALPVEHYTVVAIRAYLKKKGAGRQ